MSSLIPSGISFFMVKINRKSSSVFSLYNDILILLKLWRNDNTASFLSSCPQWQLSFSWELGKIYSCYDGDSEDNNGYLSLGINYSLASLFMNRVKRWQTFFTLVSTEMKLECSLLLVLIAFVYMHPSIHRFVRIYVIVCVHM